MNEEEFEAFLSRCIIALEQKQAMLEQECGIGRLARWTLDDHEGQLNFHDESGAIVRRFRVTPIGTFAARSESWKWGWANDKIEKSWRPRADRLRALYDKTGYDLFHESGEFAVDEVMAWELAAMAVDELGALGCYRAPNREVFLFLALDEMLTP